MLRRYLSIWECKVRIDSDYKIFCFHSEWYDVVKGIGYVPTAECPKEAAEAMERFNQRSCEKRKRENKYINKI